MAKILFPTDFSEAANKAFVYALQIAKSLDAEINTLHVLKTANLRGAHLPNTIQEIENSIKMEAFEDYQKYIPQLRKIAEEHNLDQINLNHNMVEGEPVKCILREAMELKPDMIVMGTKGAGWLKEIFVGSVAGEILENAPCPVLAIPDKATFDGAIDQIAVTTNFEEKEIKTINEVLKFARLFEANVVCVHIDTSHTESISNKMGRFSQIFEGNDDIKFESIDGLRLEDTLVKYVEQNKIDVLAMLTHKRNFFQELFNYSITKQMSYHSKVPLLAIPSV
jgi:nucleotide-binding universal stress UspA family protein